MWRLEVLKGFRLSSSEGGEFTARTALTRELLTVLALAGPSGIERSRVVTAFGDEKADPESVVAVIISRARAALKQVSAEPLIEQVGDRLRLAESCKTDVEQLRKEIRRASSQGDGRILASAVGKASELCGDDLSIGPYRSALFDTLRQNLARDLLQLLVAHANGSMRATMSREVLTLLRAIRPRLAVDATTVEGLIRIKAGLGDKEGLFEELWQYEERLQDTIGETAPASVANAVEQCLRQMDKHRSSEAIPAPTIPLFGRDPEITRLLDLSRRKGAVTFLGGVAGIGKSHILHHLFHTKGIANERTYIDLKKVRLEDALDELRTHAYDLVLVDHVADRDELQAIREVADSAAIIAAGTLTDLVYDTSVALGPLDAQSLYRREAASQILQYHFGIGSAGTQISPDDVELLAKLCAGHPLSLVLTAKLATSLGARALIDQLEIAHKASKSKSGPFEPLRAPLKLIVERLDASSAEALWILCELSEWMLITDLCQILECGLQSIRVLADNGLAEVNGAQGLISCISYVAPMLAGSMEISEEKEKELLRAVAKHYRERGSHPTSIADEVLGRSEIALVKKLVEAGLTQEGLSVLVELRGRLRAIRTDDMPIQELAELLGKDESQGDEWADAALAVGAALFFQFRFADLLEFWADQEKSGPRPGVSPSYRAEIECQQALCHWRLDRLDRSEEMMKSALALALTDHRGEAIRKVHFNLAMFYGRKGGDAHKSLSHLDEAIATPVPRSSMSTNTDLLHMRALTLGDCGADLAEVVRALELALGFAAQDGHYGEISSILCNLGLTNWKRGRPVEALVFEAVGILEKVRSGLSVDVFRSCQPSLGTMGVAAHALGHTDLAMACRVSLDRVALRNMLPEPSANVDQLMALTADAPPTVSTARPTVEEIEYLCLRCLRRMGALAAPTLDRIALITGRRVFSVSITEDTRQARYGM